MGWLKKHLNPNPVKQIKNTIQDTKDSIKKPMAMMSGGSSKAKTGGTAMAPRSMAVNETAVPVGPNARRLSGRAPARTSAGRINYSVGQGNAPAPRQIAAPIPPPTAPVRKSKTRNTMSALGAGKYRIK